MLDRILSRTRSRLPKRNRGSSESDSKEARALVSPTREPRKHIPQGRGGAGNISDHPSPMLSPDELVTPTLKMNFFTTGRGGTGNMTKNTDPEDARRAQDVTPHPRHEAASEVHIGRGGAANIVQIPVEEIEPPRKEKLLEATVTRVERESEEAKLWEKPQVSLPDKGEHWLLNLTKSKEQKERDELAAQGSQEKGKAPEMTKEVKAAN